MPRPRPRPVIAPEPPATLELRHTDWPMLVTPTSERRVVRRLEFDLPLSESARFDQVLRENGFGRLVGGS